MSPDTAMTVILGLRNGGRAGVRMDRIESWEEVALGPRVRPEEIQINLVMFSGRVVQTNVPPDAWAEMIAQAWGSPKSGPSYKAIVDAD